MKKILIITSHPNSKSFCRALADEYAVGAREAGFAAESVDVHDLSFDPVFNFKNEREPAIADIQEKITKADHLVVAYPTWWGGMPALLKGFFDRAFEAGYAFKYTGKGMGWDKLLTGKTARIMTTMDTPPLLYKLLYGSVGTRLLSKNILAFCGIKTSGISLFGSVKKSSPETRAKWLAEARELGKKGK